MQYHFLDDSGDPGLSGAAGSTSHFGLAIVQLAAHEPLPILARVRKEFHLPASFEFKYHTTTRVQREGFFRAIQEQVFRVRAVVVEKKSLEAPFRKMRGEKLRLALIVQLIMRVYVLDLANDILVLDGATPELCRLVRVNLSKESRKRKRVRPFSKIVTARSKTDDSLQLADMIAGATRNYVLGKETSYFDSFADKVVDLWRIETLRE